MIISWLFGTARRLPDTLRSFRAAVGYIHRMLVWQFATLLVVCGVTLASAVDRANLADTASWLIGANFTVAFFAVNFTVFQYQFSRYKPIFDRLNALQWTTIVLLTSSPFVPLVVFIASQEHFPLTWLWVTMATMLLACVNTLTTIQYVDPSHVLRFKFNDARSEAYLSALYFKIEADVTQFKLLRQRTREFQTPAHEYSYSPTFSGIPDGDLWDKASVILKLSIVNDDYSVFSQCTERIAALAQGTLLFPSKVDGDWEVRNGMHAICSARLTGIVNWVYATDTSNIFVTSLINRFARVLKSEDCVEKPMDDLAMTMASQMVTVAKRSVADGRPETAVKVLTAIHDFVNFALLRLKEIRDSKNGPSIEEYNISSYAHMIKRVGQTAITAKDTHIVYRCMETLSYLGCNAAKLDSHQTLIECLNCLVQLGRESKSSGLGCFWSHCMIPLHIHSEEFLGHILTWLARDAKMADGLYFKGHAEQAFSRLRGVKCKIVPDQRFNPKFWIHEDKDSNGNVIPHKETESGMYGYDGQFDYSDIDMLEEYELHGGGHIFKSTPLTIPMEIVLEEPGKRQEV